MNFNVPLVGQKNASCCWLACYQMVYGWKGRPQAEATARAVNAGLSTTSALYTNQWGLARNAMGLISYRVGYLTESFANLVYILEKHGPMWCAGDFLFGGGHAIVISGVNTTSQTLRINDPYQIYKFPGSYDFYHYDNWRKMVRDMPFACQMWF